MHTLRFRQIHLDFHTSPLIPGIGEQFDADHWTKTLRNAAVDSITLFATCHHGFAYYNGQKSERHPNLDFDLLRAQFDATKNAGINAPIYLTAGVNNWASKNHPEWRQITPGGGYAGWSTSPLHAGFHTMCFNTAYLDLLCEQIREVVSLFPNCDGIFLDIISQSECCCPVCMESMATQGYDPTKSEDRRAHAEGVLLKYYQRTTAATKHLNDQMPVFHNSGHVTVGNREILKYFSHLELESLPTGGWGYDHFPLSAKYAQTLPHDALGMTGKFHTTWGEFGGFKHPNALRYECAAMIAYGTKCSIGDQLHPCSKLDETTYDMIGQAYREVASKEAWCKNTKGLSDVAILSGAAINGIHAREHAGDVGAGRMLLEGQIQFEIIDGLEPFSGYKVILLPDDLILNDPMVTRLKEYVEQGGKLLITGTSGLRNGKPLFDLGAEFEGPSPYSPDFVLPQTKVCPDMIRSPFVMYGISQRIKVQKGESLGQIFDPYFNRTHAHFCSHQHTPFKPEPSGYDSGVISSTGIYFTHPLFSIYRGYGSVITKQMVLKALKLLLGDTEIFRSNLPSTARAVINEQPQEHRYVLHVLYANTIARGGKMDLSGGTVSAGGVNIEVIEDILPLYDVKVSLKLNQKLHSVTLVPTGEVLEFSENEDRYEFSIPKLECHQMVELKYN
jgi:hypothetical protein